MENKEEIKEMLCHFDKEFLTKTMEHIDLKELPLLNQIFMHIEESLSSNSKEYNKLLHEQIELSDKIKQTCNDNQFEMFEKYFDINDKISCLTERNLFLYGVIFEKEIKYELGLTK